MEKFIRELFTFVFSNFDCNTSETTIPNENEGGSVKFGFHFTTTRVIDEDFGPSMHIGEYPQYTIGFDEGTDEYFIIFDNSGHDITLPFNNGNTAEAIEIIKNFILV
ncbi:MAG: hypothetical protein WC979_00200 [Candidatus Pacearchaeota archaeon]|jgi:hypothetical protein|nr:hypothetical protein [Clostridia bacterium]